MILRMRSLDRSVAGDSPVNVLGNVFGVVGAADVRYPYFVVPACCSSCIYVGS